MKYCTNCGAELSEEDKFCEKCGKAVKKSKEKEEKEEK